nr:immunoglobulin heavy chain junction region [Macaca mulatta]MOW18844.1 immunoglobulin heavy chain junction region [Macaca mulatta]MOW18886.1 immunoglobulin heavy chain junction region [Macaca mulatta]MOW18889.1 immunoglobulin heavy chain junction region [Macaca mulatta]MOW18911.1 immunoglobulin heavy chain junction region [Macaca mulatta]
CARKEDDLDLW